MSASTIVVQCAAVWSERTMWSAICRRLTDSGSPAGAPAASSWYGDSVWSGRSAPSTNASTSRLVTRPRRPVPGTEARSMWCCSAIRRTTGEIGGACPLLLPFDSVAAAAPVSILASTVPTSTVVPTSTSISATRPLAGDGTSVSTLSVEISTTISSASTRSPGCFRHSTTVPSATDTPIWGIVTSATALPLVGEELTARLLHVVDLGQHRALERRAEPGRDVGSGDAHHPAVAVLERRLGDQRRDLRAHPAGARGLVEHDDLAGLAHAAQDRLAVERHE